MNRYNFSSIKHLVRSTKKAEYYYNMLNNARGKNGCFLPTLAETYNKCSSAKASAYFNCVDYVRAFARDWSDSQCIMIVSDYGVIGHNVNTFTFGAVMSIKSTIDDDFKEFRYIIITKNNVFTFFAN